MPLPSLQPTNLQVGDPGHEIIHNNLSSAVNTLITVLGGPGSSPEGGSPTLAERIADIESLIPPGSVTVSPATAFGLIPDPGTATAFAREDHIHGTPQVPGQALEVVTFFYEGLVDVLSGDRPWPVPFDGVIKGVIAASRTAGSTNDTKLDLRVNGASVFTNKPTILAGTASTEVLQVPDVDKNTVTTGDVLLLDIGPGGASDVGIGMFDLTINILFEVASA